MFATVDPITDPTLDPTIDPIPDPIEGPNVGSIIAPATAPIVDPTTDPMLDPTFDPILPDLTLEDPVDVLDMVDVVDDGWKETKHCSLGHNERALTVKIVCLSSDPEFFAKAARIGGIFFFLSM